MSDSLPEQPDASDALPAWWVKALLMLGLVAGLGYWLVRGPMRAVERLVDFPTFYSASRVWLRGGNPYDQDQLAAAFASAGGGDQTILLSVNPPGLFPLVSPLALLPYRAAQLAMIGLSILALAGTVVLIARLAGLTQHRVRLGLLIFAALVLAPVQTSISQGQFTLVVGLLLMIALWGELNKRDVIIGVALAVAVSLKPQMAIWFGPYYLLQRRWRVCIAGLTGTLLLLAVPIGWMMINGVDWLGSLTGNIEALTQSPVTETNATGTGNLAILGSGKYIMTNLAPLLYDLGLVGWAMTAATWGPILVAFGLLVWWVPARVTSARLGLCLYGCLSLLCLLTFYNRIYCLSVLLVVVGFCLMPGVIRSRGRAAAMGLLFAVLTVPGPAVLRVLEKGRLDGHWVTEGWAWQYVAMPHWIYVQVVVLAVLMGWCWKRREVGEMDRGGCHTAA